MSLSVLGILTKYLKKEALEAIPNPKYQSEFKNLIQLLVSNSSSEISALHKNSILVNFASLIIKENKMKQSFIQFSQITIEELGDFIEERIANAIKKYNH